MSEPPQLIEGFSAPATLINALLDMPQEALHSHVSDSILQSMSGYLVEFDWNRSQLPALANP